MQPAAILFTDNSLRMQTTIKLAFNLIIAAAILLVTISSIAVVVNQQEVQAQEDTFKVNVYLDSVSYKTGYVDVWVTIDYTGRIFINRCI